MLYTDIQAMRRLNGQLGTVEPIYETVGATAVKKGDPVKAGATANVVIPITAAGDIVIGVAMHDAAIGAVVALMPVNAEVVYAVKCASTKKYVASADKWTTCDFTDFTSGAMKIDPATAAQGDVLMIGLADNELDNTNENVTLCIFQKRRL